MMCPMIAPHALRVKTFHSFCLEVVRSHYQCLHFPREPTTLDSVAQAELIRECIEALSPSRMQEVRAWKPDQNTEGIDDVDEGGSREDRGARPLFQGQAKGLHNAIKYFQNWLRKSSNANRSAGEAGTGAMGGSGGCQDAPGGAWGRHGQDAPGGAWGRLGGFGGAAGQPLSTEEELKAAYDHAKSQRVLVDFDDMIHLTARLLRRNIPEANMLKNRFQYLFVDEYQVSRPRVRARARARSLSLYAPFLLFVSTPAISPEQARLRSPYQDVSPLQFELITLLSSTRRTPCLTVCGDPDQVVFYVCSARPVPYFTCD